MGSCLEHREISGPLFTSSGTWRLEGLAVLTEHLELWGLLPSKLPPPYMDPSVGSGEADCVPVRAQLVESDGLGSNLWST